MELTNDIVKNLELIGNEFIVKRYKKQDLPVSDLHKCSIEEARHIKIHAVLGTFPDELFTKRAPYQTDQEFNYLKANYRTKSHPVWIKFIGAMMRVWADQNWTLTVPEYAGEDTPMQYLYGGYPDFCTLEAYFKQIVTPQKFRDANGVLVVMPKHIPTRLTDEGEYIVDGEVKIEPVCKIFPSKNVLHFVPDEFCVVESFEKSVIYEGQKSVKKGIVLYVFDKNTIFKVFQTGRASEPKFESVIYWHHDLDKLPAWKLKGIPEEVPEGLLYHSLFTGALASLDDVLLDSSYLTACKAAHAFPQKWEYSDECSNRNEFGSCTDGMMMSDAGQVKCNICNGSGRKPSILGVYKVKTPTSTDNSTVVTPPFGWVAPSPEILEFLQKQIDSNMQLAMSILNIDNSNSDVKGSDTALGKQIDREELFVQLMLSANQIFSLFQDSMEMIVKMRETIETDFPKVSPPRSFAVRTDAELTEEIGQARDKGMPTVVIALLIEEYVQTRFTLSYETERILQIVFYSDRVAVNTTLEVNQMLLNGTIGKADLILHNSIYNFIDIQMTKDKEWVHKDLDVISAELMAMAELEVPVVATVDPNSFL